MKTYSRYKPSGIEWIGNIPEHWENRKLSRSFNLIGSGTTPKSDNLEYYENGTVNWVLTGDLNDSIIYESSKKITESAFQEHSTLKMFPKNTLLIALYGATIGKVGILDIEACTNQACCALSGSYLIDYKFAYYWFIVNRSHIINLSYGGGQPNISQEIIKSLKISCPSLTEQTTITAFLDIKTIELSNAIFKKQQLIELLEEERKAIVNEAVTKGINKKVKLIPTGVDWLGEVPEHWQIKKIKHTSYVKGRVGWNGLRSDEFLDSGYSYLITGTDFENGLVSWNTCYHIDKERYEEDPFIQLQENDLLITKDGTIGKTAIVKDLNGYACLNSGIFVVRPLNGFYITSFLYYILNSNIFTQFINFTSSGSTIQHLYQNVFNEFKFTVPPISEQTDIVNYIGKQTTKINCTISQISQEIELLKEYRQSLIFEAVTGKIKIEA
ncbi:MAG: restriction endonuclease subunit S [Bacteroidales bacterium]|nr:restriction endonuclease subunit S [Bacteroidales bacterium]